MFGPLYTVTNDFLFTFFFSEQSECFDMKAFWELLTHPSFWSMFTPQTAFWKECFTPLIINALVFSLFTCLYLFLLSCRDFKSDFSCSFSSLTVCSTGTTLWLWWRENSQTGHTALCSSSQKRNVSSWCLLHTTSTFFSPFSVSEDPDFSLPANDSASSFRPKFTAGCPLEDFLSATQRHRISESLWAHMAAQETFKESRFLSHWFGISIVFQIQDSSSYCFLIVEIKSSDCVFSSRYLHPVTASQLCSAMSKFTFIFSFLVNNNGNAAM